MQITKTITKSDIIKIFIAVLLTSLVLDPYVITPIKQRISPPSVEITAPVDGESIKWYPTGYLATGSFSGLKEHHNLYILVHPVSSSKWYVQNIPTLLDSSWQTIVQVGTAEVEISDYYELAAIVTSKSLEAGQVIESLPEHDVKDIITLRRKGEVFAITEWGNGRYLQPGKDEPVTVAWENIDTKRAKKLRVIFINAWQKPAQIYAARDFENSFEPQGKVIRVVPIPEDAEPTYGGQFCATFSGEDGYIVAHHETNKDILIAPKITITSPEPEGELPSNQDVPISGRVSGTLPDWTIWTFVESLEEEQYYPQGEVIPTEPFQEWSIIGWTGKEPYLKTGDEFNIVIALADEDATEKLHLYMEQGSETGEWNGLPELPLEAIVLEEVTIYGP